MKILNHLIAGLIVSTSAFASSSYETVFHPEVSTVVDDKGSSVDVMVSNHSNEALLCEPMAISISFIREEFDLPAGNYSPMGKSFFLYPNESRNLGNVVQDVISRLRTQNQSIRVYNAVASAPLCRKATFNDYCSYAQKNDREEKTMVALSYAFKISNCESWLPSNIVKVNLSGMDIDELYPLTFFENLSVLRIGNNPVTSVAQLVKMPNLRKVCLKDTLVPEQELISSTFRSDCI